MRKIANILCFSAIATVFGASAASATDYSNASSYNSGYGMTAGQENQAANPNLRDSNGNLTNVNGQFTSGTFASSNASGTGYATATSSSGVGSNNGTSLFGTATAIGNSLNVVTVGSYNTVVVNATQTNNGDVTATTSLNGK
ncbi:MAG: holdfast attachment protein HfaA [Alphaproteobacteria bacterium]|nr:holdfast attachment protein HfaA [Alphaproteobacteria bacterium]